MHVMIEASNGARLSFRSVSSTSRGVVTSRGGVVPSRDRNNRRTDARTWARSKDPLGATKSHQRRRAFGYKAVNPTVLLPTGDTRCWDSDVFPVLTADCFGLLRSGLLMEAR